jgi:hypothetical protein
VPHMTSTYVRGPGASPPKQGEFQANRLSASATGWCAPSVSTRHDDEVLAQAPALVQALEAGHGGPLPLRALETSS